MSWRKVLLLVVTLSVLPACWRKGPCPPRMRLVEGPSSLPRSAVCQSLSGRNQRIWIELYESGARRQQCHFEDNEASGPFKSWHPNGHVWVEGRYANGTKAGKWIQWSDTGTRVAEGEYRRGEFVAGAPVGAQARCETVRIK